MPQSRGFERPRSSRLQHSTPGGAKCLSSASVAQMLAAASIKVMDALFGFLARNDAECCKRELLGRSWRRDWGMRKFRPGNAFLGDRKNYGDWMLGEARASIFEKFRIDPSLGCLFIRGGYLKQVANKVAVMGAGKLAGRSPPIKSRRGASGGGWGADGVRMGCG